MSDVSHPPAVPLRAQPAARTPEAPQPAPRDLDPAIHDRMRLGILAALVLNDRLTFTELRNLLQMTDGNLNVHVHRLENAGYVSAQKIHEGRVSRTEYRLAPAGRKALERYLCQLEDLARALRGR